MKTSFLPRKFYDAIVESDGSITYQSLESFQEENKILYINHFNFGWVFGFGYWKDIYNSPFDGYTHNILLPFCRIQFGILKLNNKQ